MPEEATSSSSFISILSLLSQSKLLRKLRHRETKESYKADKRQDKIWPFGVQSQKPPGHTASQIGQGIIPSTRTLSARLSHTPEAGTVISHDRNKKTESREFQGPVYCHMARKRRSWDLNTDQPAQPSRDLSSVLRVKVLLAKGKASWGTMLEKP